MRAYTCALIQYDIYNMHYLISLTIIYERIVERLIYSKKSATINSCNNTVVNCICLYT